MDMSLPGPVCTDTAPFLGLSACTGAHVPGEGWGQGSDESPSLLSCLTLPGRQRLRLKSPVLRQQACPQWKHSFVFRGVTASQLRQSSLELTVWDHGVFGMSDRLLGGAKLGPKGEAAGGVDPCAQSKLQWQRVLSSPNLWTDMTLVLH